MYDVRDVDVLLSVQEIHRGLATDKFHLDFRGVCVSICERESAEHVDSQSSVVEVRVSVGMQRLPDHLISKSENP